jgi:hypothetical protein
MPSLLPSLGLAASGRDSRVPSEGSLCSSAPPLGDSVCPGRALVPRSGLVPLLGDCVSSGPPVRSRSSLLEGVAVAPSRCRGEGVARGPAAVARGVGDSLPPGEFAVAGDLAPAAGGVAAGDAPPTGEPAALPATPEVTPVVVVRDTPAPISAPGLTP